jgi:hypothetical protein
VESAGHAWGVDAPLAQKELAGQGVTTLPWQKKPAGQTEHCVVAMYMPLSQIQLAKDAEPVGEDELAGQMPHWVLET